MKEAAKADPQNVYSADASPSMIEATRDNILGRFGELLTRPGRLLHCDIASPGERREPQECIRLAK